MRTRTWTRVASLAAISAALMISTSAWAHCDTLNGPVVQAAKLALQKGDVTPVLKWVKKEREPEIKAAFKRTLAVRAKGAEARSLADTYFFETLVRIHRAGEGAPYTGLKTTPPEPVIAKADAALKSGAVDGLVKAINGHVDAGIRKRFERALATLKKADKSVEAGREFVEAYVQYTHYLEGLHQVAAGHGHEAHQGKAPHEHEHGENE